MKAGMLWNERRRRVGASGVKSVVELAKMKRQYSVLEYQTVAVVLDAE